MQLTQERLKELLLLDESRGILLWRVGGHGRVINSSAGCDTREGRRTIGIDGKIYTRARLVFLYVHGWLPKIVDHHDRDKFNDRPSNLRPAKPFTK
jgi:hypothetical protein